MKEGNKRAIHPLDGFLRSRVTSLTTNANSALRVYMCTCICVCACESYPASKQRNRPTV